MIDITKIKDTGFMTHNGLYIVDVKENYAKINMNTMFLDSQKEFDEESEL